MLKAKRRAAHACPCRRGARARVLPRVRRHASLPAGRARHRHRLRTGRLARSTEGARPDRSGRSRVAPDHDQTGRRHGRNDRARPGRPGRHARRQLHRRDRRARVPRLRRLEPRLRRGDRSSRHRRTRPDAPGARARKLGGRSARATPRSRPTRAPPATLTLAYHLDYGPDAPIRAHSYCVGLSPETFKSEIASSRTFVTETEADALRASGIGLRTTAGRSLDLRPRGTDRKLAALSGRVCAAQGTRLARRPGSAGLRPRGSRRRPSLGPSDEPCPGSPADRAEPNRAATSQSKASCRPRARPPPRHPGRHEPLASPLPVPAGGSCSRARTAQPRSRRQERQHQRTVLQRATGPGCRSCRACSSSSRWLKLPAS